MKLYDAAFSSLIGMIECLSDHIFKEYVEGRDEILDVNTFPGLPNFEIDYIVDGVQHKKLISIEYVTLLAMDLCPDFLDDIHAKLAEADAALDAA